ncbi:hypothetical protein ABZ297_27155 [Nonomuraea sp. NPDC005983]|uniref:hypothetical protein n=1 Tax=Nonomuraea sp. NPDC005983 TaxID=3155595 RepID=UPI0033AEAD80
MTIENIPVITETTASQFISGDRRGDSSVSAEMLVVGMTSVSEWSFPLLWNSQAFAGGRGLAAFGP